MQEPYDDEIRAMPSHGGHQRLGIVGGGQLASMTAAAARQLGCDVLVLERYAFSPAAHVAANTVIGNWNDPACLVPFASGTDVISIENEFISLDALHAVETGGHRLRPSVATLRLIQDKFIQKQTLAHCGINTTAFAAVASRDELRAHLAVFGLPAVLKTRRNGYDGKGNVTIRQQEDVDAAWQALQGDETPLYLEAFCDYARELATIITRASDGSIAAYPIVETIQRNHICRMVKAPAEISSATSEQAAAIAVAAIRAVDGVGSFGVEMFLTREGEVLVNELAPRVHNSGHYTIEACLCSQFENHVRAVMGWPLGSTTMIAPAAVMVNLIGSHRAPGIPRGLNDALAIAGAHIHVYGKAMSGVGRKMGHVTALGASLAEAEHAASTAASAISFGVAI